MSDEHIPKSRETKGTLPDEPSEEKISNQSRAGRRNIAKNETKFQPLDRVQKRSETFSKRFTQGRPEYMFGTIKRIRGEICYVLWDDPEVYTSGSMARLMGEVREGEVSEELTLYHEFLEAANE